ncbi:MAG: glycosyltransferase family 4 protein [Candidatus Lindowbacteria bacterium]|nr:glycosyltransferase family 4 protein [Candidatus Lindowbacteria bacterium]
MSAKDKFSSPLAPNDLPRILILTPSSEPGGTQRNIELLCRNISASQYNICVVTNFGSGELSKRVQKTEHNAQEFRCFSKPLEYSRLKQFTAKFQPHLIHSFLLRANWLASRLRLSRTELPWIAAERTMDLTRPFWKARVNARLLSKASRVHAVSQPVKDILISRDKLPSDQIKVVPGGFEPQPQSSHVPTVISTLEHPRFACLSQLRREKNVQLALESFRRFRKFHNRGSLTLIGSGSEESFLRNMASRSSLQDHVHFLGAHTNGREYLSQFDCVVIPSSEEAFPNTMLEAWASQVPVVSTDTEGAIAMAGSPSGALLVPPAKLSDAMLDISSSEELSDELIRIGSERLKKFKIETAVKKVMAEWAELIF